MAPTKTRDDRVPESLGLRGVAPDGLELPTELRSFAGALAALDETGLGLALARLLRSNPRALHGYSARILADYRRYLREYGAQMSIKEFVDLFWRRANGPRLKIPKAMELAFVTSQTGAVRRSRRRSIDKQQGAALEEELFRQRKRLADTQRSLQAKTTKSPLESERNATGKVEWALGKLSDLRRKEPTEEDSRIFPWHYAPVMVMENGRRVIEPMRYGCRVAGKPADYDFKFPGRTTRAVTTSRVSGRVSSASRMGSS